jgi:hypothetical protein
MTDQPSPARSKSAGWLLIGAGIILSVGMSVLSVICARIILNSDDPNATTRFDGGPMAMYAIFGIFSLVIAFGVVALTAGIHQLRTGEAHPYAANLVLRLWTAIYVCGIAIMIFEPD